jgi:FMN-dependent NADH-azoreductase
MINSLLIQSSPRGLESFSQKVALSIVSDLEQRYPGAEVVVRDLAQNPPPHVGNAFVAGLSTGPEQRTPEQTKALALSDLLIDELMASTLIVLAVPMHNFGGPSTLKAWIDDVARAGSTFSYSEKGPVGLLRGKRAILVLASGGLYRMARPSRSTSKNRISEPFSVSPTSLILTWSGSEEWLWGRLGRKRQWPPRWRRRRRFYRRWPEIRARSALSEEITYGTMQRILLQPG